MTDSRADGLDSGLAQERTALAWVRTALALCVGGVAAIRVLPAVLGPLAILPATVVTVLAATVAVMAYRRYRVLHLDRLAGPESSGEPSMPGGGPLTAMTTLVCALLALCGLAFMLLR